MFFIKKSAVSWLVVGLGNPGREYESTRHNAGFMALERIAGRCGVRADSFKHKALTAKAQLGGESVLLMKPQTYMNRSGESVADAARFYKIPPERILVIFDDVSLEPGRLRIRKKGSAGGHNGIKSIIEHCGEEFPRIKIGVGAKPHPDWDLADWVLSALSAQEKQALSETLEKCADAAEKIISDGCDAASNLFGS